MCTVSLFMTNSFENVSYKRHFHTTYSVSLILEGECLIEIENREYRLSKDDFRVINPFEIHSIKSSSWKHKNLVLSKEMVSDVLRREICFQNVFKDEFLKTRFLQDRIDEKWLLQYLFSNYMCEDQKALHVRTLQKAKLYMEKNANKSNISVDKIARFVGFSKYHFIREFKKEFGLTPYHYIHNLKINNARELLYRGETLSQTAQLCGFIDQSHFIRIYKKFYGHTPSKISNNLLYRREDFL